MKRVLLLATILIAFAANALAYTGSGGVWVQPRGYYIPIAKDGTYSGILDAIKLAKDRSGGFIQVHNGRYSITAPVTINGSGITFEGAGDSTLFENSASTGDTLFVIRANDVVLRNFVIDGKKQNKSKGMGIYITGNNVTIDGVKFYNMKEVPIRSIGANTTVSNCTISDVGINESDDAYGIDLIGVDKADITRNEIQATYRSAINIAGGSKDIKIGNNRVLSTLDPFKGSDGVRADSTCKNVMVNGNLFRSIAGDGVEMSADSSLVIGNTITAAQYGLHNQRGGIRIGFASNLIINSSVYGIYVEEVTPSGCWGLSIINNIIANPGIYPIHLETQTTSGDLTVQGNVMYGGIAANFSSIRLLTVNIGGRWDRVTIKDNTIYDSKKSGIEYINTLGGYVHKLKILNNTIVSPTTYGIQTEAAPAASDAYISGNVISNPGTGEKLLSSTNWTYEGTGVKNSIRASTGIFEDSLRVIGPSRFSSAITFDVPPTFSSLNLSGDLTVQGKGIIEDSLRVGTPSQAATGIFGGNVMTYGDYYAQKGHGLIGMEGVGLPFPMVKLDSVNTVRMYIPTGGNLDIYKTDGTLGNRFYGTGGLSVTGGGEFQMAGAKALTISGNDARIHSRNASGNIAFRNAANSSDIATLSDGGKFVAIDSIRTNSSLESVGSIITPSIKMRDGVGAIYTRFSQDASSNIEHIPLPAAARGGGEFRFKDGGNNWSLLRVKDAGKGTVYIGAGGTTIDDSATVIINGFDAAIPTHSPRIEFQRNSVPVFSLSGYAGGGELRATSSLGIIMGALGVTTGGFKFDPSSNGVKIGASSTPSRTLDVAGHAIISDSLRLGGGIYHDLKDLTANNATPSVSKGHIFRCVNGSATTITSFTNGAIGQEIVIYTVNSNTAIQNNANILLTGAADYAMTTGDTITFITPDGTTWYETGRSDK